MEFYGLNAPTGRSCDLGRQCQQPNVVASFCVLLQVANAVWGWAKLKHIPSARSWILVQAHITAEVGACGQSFGVGGSGIYMMHGYVRQMKS